MYQRKSNLQNLIMIILDCLTTAISLILANYLRNGRLFYSDNERMDFGLLLCACLVVFLMLNLFGRLYQDILLRGPLHELIHIIRNNLVVFAGSMVILYFLHMLEAYSRLVLFGFFVINCVLMMCVHQLGKVYLPVL